MFCWRLKAAQMEEGDTLKRDSVGEIKNFVHILTVNQKQLRLMFVTSINERYKLHFYRILITKLQNKSNVTPDALLLLL